MTRRLSLRLSEPLRGGNMTKYDEDNLLCAMTIGPGRTRIISEKAYKSASLFREP